LIEDELPGLTSPTPGREAYVDHSLMELACPFDAMPPNIRTTTSTIPKTTEGNVETCFFTLTE
jgi:hypothetical protein